MQRDGRLETTTLGDHWIAPNPHMPPTHSRERETSQKQKEREGEGAVVCDFLMTVVKAFRSEGMTTCAVPRHAHEPPLRKKPKLLHQEEEEEMPLIPGLPDHIAQLCLSGVRSPRLLFSVCRSWRSLLYSPSFPPFLSLYALLSSSSPASIEIQAFDPIAAAWNPLPPHPHLRRFLLSHPDFISRSLPIQSVSVADQLVVLAGTTDCLLPALQQPLVFRPDTCQWYLAPPLQAPRRWCAAGAAAGRVYVASGVSCGFSGDVARSVERWDPDGGTQWEPVARLKDGRFSREAVEAVACAGKLCVVNVRGRAAKDGAVYDVEGDRWEGMPDGMLAGWTGPAAGEDGGSGTIYVADEAQGVLRAYDWRLDRWRTVVKSELLKDAVHVAVGGGRVCVASAGGTVIVVVDVCSRPARIWTFRPPTGRKVVGLHVLPRASRLL